ncbi:MAG: RlmE family RNA methyltransferase [Alphaproteobacteria bacterium]|nr:RlmE family RNA methyltransferase [Alphaproteobacteria bacterium]TAD89440.1 MAG: RlmE family RNA methyltransferase [Alphaproteobacteria bacterium]
MSKRGDSSSGRRRDPVKVTSTTRKESSKRWLARHLSDPWVAEAQRQGWRSRAAFKLIQLDDKYRLLRPGQVVVDLGAAPGGWTQVAVQRTRARDGAGKVVGWDILEMEPVPGAIILQGDFLADDAVARLEAAVGGRADVVLSDMAANTVGHARTDHLRVMALAEAAFAFAEAALNPGGHFVAKVFQGGSERTLLDQLKRCFQTVRHAKPPASRSESAEMFVVASGFRAD